VKTKAPPGDDENEPDVYFTDLTNENVSERAQVNVESKRVRIRSYANDFVNATAAASGAAVTTYHYPVAKLRTIDRYRIRSRKKLRKINDLQGRVESQLGEAPTSIVKSIEVLVTTCDLHSYRRRISSERWGRVHYSIGIPSAVLAATAAALVESSAIPKIYISACALLSAVLAALVTFLKSESNKERNHILSAEWSDLADAARVHLLDYSRVISQADQKESMSIDSEYSKLIIGLNRNKGRLLRGEVVNAENTNR
jgi:hypothetical protein